MASAVAETDQPTPAKDGPNSGAANGEPSTRVPTVTTNREATSAVETRARPSSQSNGHVTLETVLSNGSIAADSDAGVESDSFDNSSSSRALSPVMSPPYWRINHGNFAPGSDNTLRSPNGHSRTDSVESVLPAGAITLQDNESSVLQARDRNAACWAKSVEVTNYIIVNGSATNFGAFVVWNIKVETLSGSFMNIRKRYSEFDEFRRRLIQTFPGFEAAVPALPAKSVISKFRPRFLEKRRAGLQYFLNCIMLNPEFSGSPVLKDFLFN